MRRPTTNQKNDYSLKCWNTEARKVTHFTSENSKTSLQIRWNKFCAVRPKIKESDKSLVTSHLADVNHQAFVDPEINNVRDPRGLGEENYKTPGAGWILTAGTRYKKPRGGTCLRYTDTPARTLHNKSINQWLFRGQSNEEYFAVLRRIQTIHKTCRTNS